MSSPEGAPTVLVTGAAGGIGQAVGAVFKHHGWFVMGVDVAEPDVTRAFDVFIVQDVGDTDALEEYIRRAIGSGNLSALVNNAAIQPVGDLQELTEDDWDRTLRINARAPWILMKSLSGRIVAGRGAIVNVGSVHSLVTSPGMSAYAASKGALMSLTRAVALEMAPLGVRVNAVLPGAVATPMLTRGLEGRNAGADADESREALTQRIPMRRLGTPADVGEAVHFLSDPSRSGYITGQALVVDGGATARLATE